METLKTIAMRKSVRGYKPTQISEKELDTILQAAFAAPCGMGAYESLHITVVQNKEFMDKLTAHAANLFGKPELTPLFGAPTLIVVSSTEQVVASVKSANVACLIENMTLAATDIGLGSLLLWGVFRALSESPELIKELSLPEGFVPQAGIAIGYASEPLSTDFVNEHTISIKYFK